MSTLLAGALLTLAQGPYSSAPPDQAPADAPVWVAGETAEEHVFQVSARYECPPDTQDGFVQVSISDTLERAEFAAGEHEGRRLLTIAVPGKQLKGLRPELFCPQPEAAEKQAVRLESRFTGQGALICRNADGKTTSAQASVALDAWVICPAAAPQDNAAGAGPDDAQRSPLP